MAAIANNSARRIEAGKKAVADLVLAPDVGFRSFVTGHDFSRAINIAARRWALAPEGGISPSSPETKSCSAGAKAHISFRL
jgi:hypothetical protein